jgi:multidrug efflux pump subunit AcrB
MNKAIEWFVENKVAANLLMIIIFAAGIVALLQIKKEVFPEFATDMISITVPYLGAAPEEVEEGVCIKIEEAIQDLEGIKKITSTAMEGVGRVTVEVLNGVDVRKILDDVKSRVDAISTFPVETEKPVIQETLNRRQVINVAVTGNTDEKSLKRISEQVRDELSAIQGISQVELSAARPYEIAIEVSENALRRFNLTFSEVAQSVRLSSLDLPGGSIKTSSGELTIRTKGQVYEGLEYENLILRSLPDGTRLYVRDVANVVDGFAETDQSARFNGKPAILVQVFRVGDESATEVANSVKEYIVSAQQRLPEGITLTAWQDDSLVFKDRLNLLLRNGRTGFILVFLSLALFLQLRLAWWVIVGMILSFFGAFWAMPQFDVSINMISMFAFILVLGIVVDDAIVLGENIYTHLERGKSGKRAAIEGAQEVAKPVIFAVLTTIAAFSPLLNVPGFMGKIMYVIPIIVISTLVFSLIDALFILPAHLSHFDHKKDKENEESNSFKQTLKRLHKKIHKGLYDFSNIRYRKFLELALRWRYVTVSVGITVWILTLSFVGGGWIKFVFMPAVEADNVVALLTMPQGTSKEQTEKIIKKIEESAVILNNELNKEEKGPIQHILASIGEQPFLLRQRSAAGPRAAAISSHLGEVNLQLVSAEVREITSAAIAQRWRELTGTIPEAEELVFSSSLFSAGDPVNFQLSGANYEELLMASNELQQEISTYAGVYDIADSYREGKSEIKLKVKPEAEAMGLSLSSLARQVRQAFYGEEVQRIQRGRDEIRVMVRYPQDQRRSIADLENMRIRIPGVGDVPFNVAAAVVPGTGFASINRTDRNRTVNITADVDLSKANPNEIVSDIIRNVLPDILSKYPGLTYSLEGEQNAQMESINGLMRGFVFALLIIYILLAIPFKSYLQPLIVMSAIPFGFTGAILGHVVMGVNLTIISGFGIVALTGVVVNDSLVLVDFINRSVQKGQAFHEAIVEAGVSRFRPIMLTSLTTFAGLTPLMLEKSMQAQFLIPMAISLAFGVIFATVITLILVPTFYDILEDIKSVYNNRNRTENKEKLSRVTQSGPGPLF